MEQDLKALQGSWSITSLVMDGRESPAAAFGEARIEVKGERFRSTGMGAVYEGVLTLDTSKKPAHLDMTFDTGPQQGTTNRAIYEVDGETWKLCLATRGDERPKKFASKAGSGVALETLVRGVAAPAPKKAPVSRTASDAPSTASPSEFEGEWRMVSGVMNGAEMDASMVSWVKRIFQGDHTSVVAGPQTMMKAAFRLSAPQSIDYRNIAGSHKGKEQLGIYHFDGKILKICMAAPGAPRPTDFTSVKGDARALTIWTR